MALPQQLKTARMTNSTLGIDIDDRVGDVEKALADILGFTIDTDITESPFSCDNSGRITKALVRFKAAGPVGVRILNSTNSKEFRLVLDGTDVKIDENTGTEAAPTWTNRASMALATGVWTFTGIPVGPASSCTTANELTRKQYVDDKLGVFASYSKLKVKNNVVTPDTQIDLSADMLSVGDGTNYMNLAALSATINCATTGANALDIGTLAASTLYYFWAIAKADGTKAGLASLSATAPTMPSSYTFKRLVGAMSTDASVHFRRFVQDGPWVRYREQQQVVTNGTGNGWFSEDCGVIVPSMALTGIVTYNGVSSFGAINVGIGCDSGVLLDYINANANYVVPFSTIPIPFVTAKTFYMQILTGLTANAWVKAFEMPL
jgi:hypothetical protein